MTIFEELKSFVDNEFKTDLEIFLQAIKLSPNARGYIGGSLSELLLKRKLEEEGFEIKRIREKWEGKKHRHHHGDFYFKKPDLPWFVLESKGVKSNAEKWRKLYNYENLKKFLARYANKFDWIDKAANVEPQIDKWIYQNLPKFQDEYKSTLYSFNEIQNYNKPKRENDKSRAISALGELNREQLSNVIDKRLRYLQTKLRILVTHFVAGLSKTSLRKQATPRIDEFNIISVDIFLKYDEHKFLFANPKNLKPSKNKDHLRQNYEIGLVFFDEQGEKTLILTEDWRENLNEVYETLNAADAISEADWQPDTRSFIPIEEADEDVEAR